MVDGGQLADRAVIRHRDAAKAHLAAQQVPQNGRAAAHRLAVDGSVGVHHPAQVRPGDRRLEGLGVDLPQFARRDRGAGRVDAALPGHKAQKVLGRGEHLTALLQPGHVGRAHRGGERRVLAIAFALAAKPRVAADVQHWGQPLGKAQHPPLAANQRGHPALERGVPGRGLRQPAGEAACVGHQCAGQRLDVQNCRDAVGAGGQHGLLGFAGQGGDLLPVLHHGHGQAGNLPHAAGEAFFDWLAHKAVHHRPALQLGKLFVQIHPGQQVPGALLGAKRGVKVSVHGTLLSVQVGVGHSAVSSRMVASEKTPKPAAFKYSAWTPSGMGSAARFQLHSLDPATGTLPTGSASGLSSRTSSRAP